MCITVSFCCTIVTNTTLKINYCCCCSVTKLSPILCDPMDWSTPGFPVLQHPRTCSNSCQLSRWCHPTIMLCHPLLLCPPSFPATGSFPMNWLFASGGQSLRASASATVLPMNIQGWFPLGLAGLISLLSKGLLKSLVQYHSSKASGLWHSAFLMVQLSHLLHDYWKNHSSNYTDLCMLSSFVIAFLPRSKHLLIAWLQSPSGVILEPPKIKYLTVSIFPHLFAIMC